MTLTISQITPDELDDFIRVPYRLYANLRHWVPPLLQERRDALKPGGTPYTKRAETAMWIATRAGAPVGRISAQIDPVSQEKAPGVGHFGLLAAIDDATVFDLLLATAEEWLKARGMTRVLGPMNLSINEECGLLVDGFDTPPMMMMPHDPPYAAAHIAARGYTKAKDLLAYRIDVAAPMPEAVQRIADRPLPANVAIRPLDTADYAGEVRRLVAIFNDAWAGNWGFIPFDAAEIDLMAEQMRPLIDKRLVWFAEVDGEAAAFVVCLPNLNEAIADLGGRLLPFGWAKLLWRIKVRGLASGRVPLMGVRREMSSTLLGGILPFLLIDRLRRAVRKMRMRTIEMSWVLDDNRPMRTLAEAMCGPAYKTYRLFEKDFA
jgi:hypothetical protein